MAQAGRLAADPNCRPSVRALPSSSCQIRAGAAAHPACPTHPSPAQIAKLLIIPFVCFVESSFLGRTFTREVVASIMLVVAGVAVVTGEPRCWTAL